MNLFSRARSGTSPASHGAPFPLSPAYRAVWRWHFYAGLLVLPVLMLMALTGAVYLFKPEIDGWLQRDMARVTPAAVTVAPSTWVAAAEGQGLGRPTAVLVPAGADEAVRVTVRDGEGASRLVFVDPYRGVVTGVAPQDGFSETLKKLHSLELAGPWANMLVEVAAGWTIVLVATGVFLWWPRRERAVGVVAIRNGDMRRRLFWRDLHAVAGLYGGAVILFLAVTGMPWSAVWGDGVMGWVRDQGWGRPPAPAASSGFSHAGVDERPSGLGWTLERSVLRVRLDQHAGHGDHAGHSAPAKALSLDRVTAAAAVAGLPRPYLINIPQTPDKAWAIAHQSPRAEDARILYLHPVTGAVLGQITARDFGAGARAFEWGIAVHEGRQYGWANRILMLFGCIAVWVLGISAAVMWWKRRPKGRLAAPVVPPGARAQTAVLAIVLPLAVIYPMVGLSLIAALVLDRVVALTIRRATPAAPG